MKALLIAVSLILTSSFAQASGFECEVVGHDLDIKVYNHTEPTKGTRTAAVMILSNPAVGHGNKTIARFSGETGLLDSSRLTYTAKVDLRYADSNRKGELLLGTKLGQLKTLTLDVDFSYASPDPKGAFVPAVLTWVKRNGSVESAPVVCLRYLKN